MYLTESSGYCWKIRSLQIQMYVFRALINISSSWFAMATPKKECWLNPDLVSEINSCVPLASKNSLNVCLEWLVKTLYRVSSPCSKYYHQCLAELSENCIKGKKREGGGGSCMWKHSFLDSYLNVPGQQSLKSALELCLKRGSQCVFSCQAHSKLMHNSYVLAKVISKVFTLTTN